MMRRGMRLFLGAILFMGVFIQAASAAPVEERAWAKYLSSQKKLQIAVHHLMGLRWPHLEPVLKTIREFKFASLEAQNQRFQYLKEVDPERLVTDQTFREFVDFEWNDQDDAHLSKRNNKYRKLKKQMTKLRSKRDKNPFWDEVQERLMSLEKDPEYITILARFRFVGEEIEKILGISQEKMELSGIGEEKP